MVLLTSFGSVPVCRVKLYFCGPPSIGKTTLVDSLCRTWIESLWSSKETRAADEHNPDERTAGVTVTQIKLGGACEFSAWDYAGHSEYYVTHELFLADATAVFAVLCDLHAPRDQRVEGVMYWLRFINTRFMRGDAAPAGTAAGTARGKPRVVIVGSNADRALPEVITPRFIHRITCAA